MKKIILISAVILTTIFGLLNLGLSEFESVPQDQVLRHVVLLDLNEQATDSVIQNMEEDLKELEENISQIRKLEFGTNIQNGAEYSHCMLLTFEDLVSLAEYENHPMHLEFASKYGKYVEKKTEVDYWQ